MIQTSSMTELPFSCGFPWFFRAVEAMSLSARGFISEMALREELEPPGESGRDELVIARDMADVEAVLSGDGDRYSSIVKRYQNYVSKIMWRFSRDRQVHEELVHDTFVEAYMSLGGYRGKSGLASWLATIATRQGYKFWREQSLQKASPLQIEEWDMVADPSQADSVEPEKVSDLLFKLLGQLPARDRLVMTLRYIEDCSVEETAGRTGWSQTMVKVQLWRAKKKLLELYNDTVGGKNDTDR